MKKYYEIAYNILNKIERQNNSSDLEEIHQTTPQITINLDLANALADILKFNTTIDEICLKATNLGDEEIIPLAEALKFNKRIKFLDLSYNQISDEGIIALADGLKGNTKLKKIYLAGNRITDRGLSVLAEVLKINSTLKTIDGSHNKMDSQNYLQDIFLNTELEDKQKLEEKQMIRRKMKTKVDQKNRKLYFEIGTKMRKMRKKLNITSQTISNLLGVSLQQIVKYEKGVNKIPLGSLLILSGYFNVPITEFIFNVRFNYKEGV